MSNLAKEIIEQTENLIFKFEFKGFDFEHLDAGQPFTLDYEKKRYRQDELTNLLFSTLPYFALKEEEFSDYLKAENSPNFIQKKAINNIVKPEDKAGDYGEMMLFLLLEVFYKSKKLVTKVHYKTSGDRLPVNGADAAHFTLENDGQITLWFGESKFYKDFGDALNKAVDSVDKFLQAGLKKEVEFLTPSRVEINKEVDKKLRDKVLALVRSGISLDKLHIKIPILIAYELSDLGKYSDINDSDFIKYMRTDFEGRFAKIKGKSWTRHYKNVSFVFFLLPIHDVAAMKELIKKKDEGIRS